MKSATQAMDFEVTGNTKASKGTGKRAAIKVAERLSTPRLLWIVVTRHKVGLLSIGNIILILNFIFPAWFDLVLGMIGK